MSQNKGIPFDIVSESIFKIENLNEDRRIKIFSKLWSPIWNKRNFTHFFNARLVPLNKDFPRISTVDRIRPILVMNPLVKFLESRFAPKLQNYLKYQLFPSQVGFVPGQGIFTNIYRLFDRLMMRKNQGLRSYLIFIDFSNAYNSIYHSILFERLSPVLDLNEIQFLKAMYQRYRVKIGDFSFHPVRGVAQGSIVSPALFNIYLEPLLLEVSKFLKNAHDDQFGYADDLLIMGNSEIHCESIIKLIEE